jgi:MFS family permease
VSTTTEEARAIGFGPKFVTPVLMGPLLNPINTTMISVGLVPIATSLHVASSTVIWLVAALYLASAIAQPTMGTLADAFGPRRVYLTGLMLVVVAGAIPLFWHTFLGVLASRILLGIGTSAAYPSAMTLIREQSARLGRVTPTSVLSGLSISSLTSAAIGPPLGGLLIALFGWESIFAVNIPLAGAALVMAWLWLPADAPRPRGAGSPSVLRSLDPVGFGLFAVTVASLLFFLLDLDRRLWLLAVLAVVGTIALIAWERRHPRPFLDVRMLAANGPLSRTYLRLFLVYTATYLATYSLSQWMQDAVGIASGTAGLLQLPATVLAGLASVVVSRTTRVRVPLLLAAIVPIGGGIAVVLLQSSWPIWAFAAVAAIFGAPQGLASVSNQQALYRQAPVDRTGTASGLSRTSVYLGAILASSLIGVFFGDRPTDAGVHSVGWAMIIVSVLAAILTVFDRTLPTGTPRRAARRERTEPTP